MYIYSYYFSLKKKNPDLFVIMYRLIPIFGNKYKKAIQFSASRLYMIRLVYFHVPKQGTQTCNKQCLQIFNLQRSGIGHSRDTDNTNQMTQNEDKQRKYTTQKIKKINYIYPTKKKPEVKSSFFRVTSIVRSCNTPGVIHVLAYTYSVTGYKDNSKLTYLFIQTVIFRRQTII